MAIILAGKPEMAAALHTVFCLLHAAECQAAYHGLLRRSRNFIKQLLDFLSDENTNIVFYTPVGLEIGFNYTTSDSTGWVTATIKDYAGYVPKFRRIRRAEGAAWDGLSRLLRAALLSRCG